MIVARHPGTYRMARVLSERFFRRALVWIALAGLLLGLAAWVLGRSDLANWCWAGGTIPVVTTRPRWVTSNGLWGAQTRGLGCAGIETRGMARGLERIRRR